MEQFRAHGKGFGPCTVQTRAGLTASALVLIISAAFMIMLIHAVHTLTTLCGWHNSVQGLSFPGACFPMPVITLQLGQCGNQLGHSFFQTMATELGTGDYHASGVSEWFRPVESRQNTRSGHSHVARSVLIDMEPKVVQGVMAAAASARSWWRYAHDRQLCMSSGSGNNWAHGYNGYGPQVHQDALELVRKEVEACDVLGGFLLLQSMAGGTGAGLGTYVAEALRDEYPSCHALNCCVWPYESGEVIVQPYNTLFTMSHLSDVSDGLVLLENEALHQVAHRLHHIPRPSFMEMNLVAARALACTLLPSHTRAPHGSTTFPAASSPGSAGIAGDPRPARRGAGSPAGGMPGVSDRFAGLHVSSPSVGAREPVSLCPVPSRPVRLLSEVLGHCAAHPGYRLMSLRALPQMPATSVDFTTFTWPAITKRLRQMLITGSSMEEGMDWGLTTSTASCTSNTPGRSPPVTHLPRFTSDPPDNTLNTPLPPAPGPHGFSPHLTPASAASAPGSAPLSGSSRAGKGRADTGAGSGRRVNKSVSSWLVLRGQGAADVDVSAAFLDPGLYPTWSCDPLAVSCHPARFTRCEMAAALLAADQACVEPCARMQERAYHMYASRAYVHQYEGYGLQAADFESCFAHVEDVLGRYDLL